MCITLTLNWVAQHQEVVVDTVDVRHIVSYDTPNKVSSRHVPCAVCEVVNNSHVSRLRPVLMNLLRMALACTLWGETDKQSTSMLLWQDTCGAALLDSGASACGKLGHLLTDVCC
jgi:hypothetical protein